MPDDAITMMYGTSRVFDFPQRLRRVSIADTSIADLQVINPHQLMLIGHKPGFTTLAVWDNQGNYEERQVRIEQTGHQQVLLNCTVAELNRSRIENQGINLTGAIPRLRRVAGRPAGRGRHASIRPRADSRRRVRTDRPAAESCRSAAN